MIPLLSNKKTITVLSLLLTLIARVNAQSCEDICKKMFDASKNVRTLRSNMTSVERVNSHLNINHYSLKMNASPYEAYSKNIEKGVEVLYLEGKNNDEATVNPNGFPYVTLHLDPLGKVMRKDEHQTIKKVGFNYLSDLLYHTLGKYPDAYTNYVKRDADTICDGSPCYKIEINFPLYENTSYIITEKGETVSKLAARYYLSEYKILTLNNLSWYEDELKVGQHILLPSNYAKSTILFIRKDDYIPVLIRTYDDEGLFEEYKYTNFQLNPTISDSEFTEKYPGYHF